MKKLNMKKLFLLVIVFTTFKTMDAYNITVNWEANGQILQPFSSAIYNSNVPVYKIATISSDADCSSIDALNALNWLVTSSRNDLFATMRPMVVFIHDKTLGSFNASTATPFKTGSAALYFQSVSIAPCNGTSNGIQREYEIWFGFNLDKNTSNCQWLEFGIAIVDMFGNIKYNQDRKVYFSNYASTWSEWNTPDLFIKDNDIDGGFEPNWQTNTAWITKSNSIRNTIFGTASRSSNGLNPNLFYSNYAQRSTLGNYNNMNVWVENRGCVATTATANLNMFWTVARLWETWGHDWHNYVQYSPFAGSNFTNWLDPATSTTIPKPLGNHITLSDKDDYKSVKQSVVIPSGVGFTNYNSSYIPNGGYLTSVQWSPPDVAWYTSSSTIFRDNGKPVLCYLAVIEEPYKTDNGFYQSYATNSNTSILDYCLYNNNVASVNSFLATPTGLYKTATPADNKYRSEIGVIHVTNPRNLPSTPISIKVDSCENNFNNNGTIYVIFDEILWAKWSATNKQGSGFEIVSPQVVKIIDSNLATFNGIYLGEEEKGMLGIQFEYDGTKVPENDYDFHLTVGEFDSINPNKQIGSPSHFSTQVLHTPAIEQTRAGKLSNVKNTQNLPQADFVNIYPNPTIDKLNIMFDLKEDVDYISLEIYDINLRQIKKLVQTNTQKGGKSYIISTNDLANGNYLLKININNNYQTFKFVK